MKRFLYSVVTDQISGGWVDLLKVFLRLLSFFYGAAVRIIYIFYNLGVGRSRLSAPVISVGNITAGGTGKTPLVEYLARILTEKNLRPVILTRGYMGRGIGRGSLESDEAQMLKKVLADVPVLAGADRLKNAREFAAVHPVDMFILDDGFQHWRLARDLDIVVLDAVNPWGNGFLLPRGVLREPLSALRRADVIVLTKTDLGKANVDRIKSRLQAIGCRALVVDAVHQPVDFVDLRCGESRPLSFVAGKEICSFCSIGDPRSFFQTLENLGARLSKDFAFTDHHQYQARDIQEIVSSCRSGRIAAVVTTQKDAVKLNPFRQLWDGDPAFLSLRITMKITQGEHDFVERISRLS